MKSFSLLINSCFLSFVLFKRLYCKIDIEAYLGKLPAI